MANVGRPRNNGPRAPIGAKANKLSAAEIVVLEMAAAGRGEQETAEALKCSYWSVKVKRRHLIAKLGADNMLQAVGMAMRRKIIK
jgi:DNA-binding CsgD family transcriptional regulator